MNEYSFDLKLTSSKKITMGDYNFTSDNNYKLSFDIKIDPEQADMGGEIIVYNLSTDLCDIFVINNNPNNYFEVELVVSYLNNKSKILKGYCIESLKEKNNNNSLVNLILKVQGLGYKELYSFRFEKGANYYSIKKTIADKLGLKLSSSMATDTNILQQKWYIDTYTPIVELKSFFKNQSVYINNGTLYFAEKKGKEKQLLNTKQFTIDNELLEMSLCGVNEYSIKTFLFPQVQPSDLVFIKQTGIYKKYSGEYYVKSIRHQGMITKYGGGTQCDTECVIISKIF